MGMIGSESETESESNLAKASCLALLCESGIRLYYAYSVMPFQDRSINYRSLQVFDVQTSSTAFPRTSLNDFLPAQY